MKTKLSELDKARIAEQKHVARQEAWFWRVSPVDAARIAELRKRRRQGGQP